MNFRFSIFNWQLEILNEYEFSPEISGFNWQLEILNELRPFARFEIKLNTEVDNDYDNLHQNGKTSR